jgi:adenylate cyclase
MPAMDRRTKLRWRIVGNFALIGGLGGGLYGLGAGRGAPDGFLLGLASGAGISVLLAWFEVFFMNGPGGARLLRLSFARLIALKTVFYAAVILAGVEVAALLLPVAGRSPLQLGWPLFGTLFSGLGFSLLANFIMQVNLMLGQGELLRFIRGRYHHPREEERIFLFLDLIGSTALAERVGGVRFLELLNLLYSEIVGPIVSHRGEIHKYVGDEVIVTWTPERGLPDAHCLRCALEIQALLTERAASFRAQFDAAPAFRAGVHLGTVVSGELGSLKREIAYLGDTMNTAARIVEVCRERGRSIIASGALVDRLAEPRPFRAEPLGTVLLRGKETALPLYAIEAI